MQDDNDESIFTDLMAGVESVVRELDAICEANGLSKTERPYQDAVIREDGLNAVCLEVFANKIVPFDMSKTSDAVYEHFTRTIKHMPYRSYQQKVTLLIAEARDLTMTLTLWLSWCSRKLKRVKTRLLRCSELSFKLREPQHISACTRCCVASYRKTAS